MPTVIEQTLVPTNPFAAGLNGFELMVFCASLMIALAFLVYLARCYVQEFRRERRVQRRKRNSRANCSPGWFQPLCLAARPNAEPSHDAASEEIAPMPVEKLDCWGLQWVIPEHEQITLVWETSTSREVSSVHYVQRADTSGRLASTR